MLAFSVNACFANAPISRAITFDSFSAPRGGQFPNRASGPKQRKPSVIDTRMGVGSSVHSVGLIAHSPSPRASQSSGRRASSSSTSSSYESAAAEWPPVSVDVVSYYIHTCSSPYVLYRLIVTDSKGNQTNMHRRYNDFVELHTTLVKRFPSTLPQAMSLPPKRYIKRRKFDPLHMEQRREALDRYVKVMLGVHELASSDVVRAFLGDHWKRDTPHPRYVHPVMVPAEHLPLPPPSPPQKVAQPIPTSHGRTQQQSPASCSCSPLGPADKKPHMHPPARPRSPNVRKRQLRKMPLPLEIELGTTYVACNRRILELRREYDTERPYSHHGTPPRPESYFNKNPKQLARPPAGFFDTVFPTPQMISKQQAFLKEFYRKRWGQVMPHGLTPSP